MKTVKSPPCLHCNFLCFGLCWLIDFSFSNYLFCLPSVDLCPLIRTMSFLPCVERHWLVFSFLKPLTLLGLMDLCLPIKMAILFMKAHPFFCFLWSWLAPQQYALSFQQTMYLAFLLHHSHSYKLQLFFSSLHLSPVILVHIVLTAIWSMQCCSFSKRNVQSFSCTIFTPAQSSCIFFSFNFSPFYISFSFSFDVSFLAWINYNEPKGGVI